MNQRKSDINLGEKVRIMEAVSSLKRQDSAVYEQLNFDQKREVVREELRKTYLEMGAKDSEISDSHLDKAIDDYYSKRWEFDPGQTGKGDGLWNAYIKRGWITKHVILPAMAVGLGIMATTGVVKHANEKRLVAQEESIENAVESAYQTRINLENKFERVISNQPDYLNGSETSKIMDLGEQASITLNKTTPFLKTYCPQGIADDEVTRENMYKVKEKLETTTERLTSSKSSLGGIEGIVTTAKECESLKGEMTGVFSRFQESDPHKNLETKAETLYESGINHTETREIVQARRSLRELKNIFSDSQTFKNLIGKLPNLYSAIKKSAKQDKAVDMGEDMYEVGESAIETGNVNLLRTTTENMRDLLGILNKDYKIQTVQRQGFRTGLWRHSNDNPSRNTNDEDPRGKMFYLVSEARDSSSGAPIKVKLENIETRRTDNVSIFGTRVPHEVYLMAKADMMDNGLLDNSARKFRVGGKTYKIPKGTNLKLISRKPLGYIDPIMILTDNNGKIIPDMGHITKEDRGFRK